MKEYLAKMNDLQHHPEEGGRGRQWGEEDTWEEAALGDKKKKNPINDSNREIQ